MEAVTNVTLFFKLWSKRPGKVGAGAAGAMLAGIPLG